MKVTAAACPGHILRTGLGSPRHALTESLRSSESDSVLRTDLLNGGNAIQETAGSGSSRNRSSSVVGVLTCSCKALALISCTPKRKRKACLEVLWSRWHMHVIKALGGEGRGIRNSGSSLGIQRVHGQPRLLDTCLSVL